MSSKSVAEDLDRLASYLLQEALSKKPPEGINRLEVFKAVSQYHIGSTRAEKWSKDEAPEGGTFQDLVRGLESAKPNGAADGE